VDLSGVPHMQSGEALRNSAPSVVIGNPNIRLRHRLEDGRNDVNRQHRERPRLHLRFQEHERIVGYDSESGGLAVKELNYCLTFVREKLFSLFSDFLHVTGQNHL